MYVERKMLVNFRVIWIILRPFGNVVVRNLVFFPPFWYIVARKTWQPCQCRVVLKIRTYVE
jgi:hypothetical protein